MEIGDTVLIADGDNQARRELARLLASAGYGVMEADRGDSAMSLARSNDLGAVILEIPLEGLCGYEICHLLKSEPETDMPVVFLSGTRTETYDRIAGLLLKADDYLVKPYEPGELLARLSNLIRRFHTRVESTPQRLTKREEEVLGLMGEGLRHNEIARRLFISPKTVATHVEHIFRKLRVSSSTQAVVVAYREQLIPPRRRTPTSEVRAPDPSIAASPRRGGRFRPD